MEMINMILDAVLDPWLTNLWLKVLMIHPLPPGEQIISADIRPPSRFKVEIVKENLENSYSHLENGKNDRDVRWSREKPFKAKITSNERVTAPDHFQDVRLIKIDISGSELSYRPGDVVMIQPENTVTVTQKLIDILNLNPATIVNLTKNDPDQNLPICLQKPLSIYELVKKYFDIQSVPKRYFFQLLSFFTTSEMEKERLQEFSSAEGQEELYSYCYRTKRNFYEVFEDFPIAAANLPLDYLFDLIPGMKPRAFSIASSQMMHPTEIHILMAVVRYKTTMHFPRLGVCSNWLATFNADRKTEDTVPIWISSGTITIPRSSDVPILMIGPGTGVAPFRSFIEHRVLEGSKDNVLFFGSRNRSNDFYFEDEWNNLQKSNHLELYTAFSRDQDEKIYVQHRLEEQSEMIWDLIHKRNGTVFIAGNSKDMPNDVIKCLKNTASKYGHFSEEETETYFKRLEITRRLQCETWS